MQRREFLGLTLVVAVGAAVPLAASRAAATPDGFAALLSVDGLEMARFPLTLASERAALFGRFECASELRTNSVRVFAQDGAIVGDLPLREMRLFRGDVLNLTVSMT